MLYYYYLLRSGTIYAHSLLVYVLAPNKVLARDSETLAVMKAINIDTEGSIILCP